MKPIGHTSYDIEMNKKYGITLAGDLSEIEDFDSEEQHWYEWLQDAMEKQGNREIDTYEHIVGQELIDLIYHILLLRNVRYPNFIDGVYRTNAVIKVNKLLKTKGGMNKFGMEEFSCAGLYTVHPVWFFEEDALPANIGSYKPCEFEAHGIPDILTHTQKEIYWLYDKEKFKFKKVYAYLEATPFSVTQINYNGNWDCIHSFGAWDDIHKKITKEKG